jgi:hypothetical protein
LASLFFFPAQCYGEHDSAFLFELVYYLQIMKSSELLSFTLGGAGLATRVFWWRRGDGSGVRLAGCELLVACTRFGYFDRVVCGSDFFAKQWRLDS